jgi:hypothetical protein
VKGLEQMEYTLKEIGGERLVQRYLPELMPE